MEEKIKNKGGRRRIDPKDSISKPVHSMRIADNEWECMLRLKKIIGIVGLQRTKSILTDIEEKYKV